MPSSLLFVATLIFVLFIDSLLFLLSCFIMHLQKYKKSDRSNGNFKSFNDSRSALRNRIKCELEFQSDYECVMHRILRNRFGPLNFYFIYWLLWIKYFLCSYMFLLDTRQKISNVIKFTVIFYFQYHSINFSITDF